MTPEQSERLREARLAVFEDRLIHDVQPPVTDDVLARIAERCSGPIPDDLVALWRTCFGGTVDYDLTADFDGTIAHISFRELFYPGSRGYRDLWGWIDHECELAEEAAADAGKPWSGKLDYLPFGGFEYLSRMYVRVAPGPDHGAVIAWEKGLPPAWRLRLHADSIARIGPDVRSLFRALVLHDDPRATTDSELVEPIRALGDPALERELLAMIGRAVLDWRGALASGTIDTDPRLVRQALYAATRADDVATLEQLRSAGCDLAMQVTGGGTALDLAVASEAKKSERWLRDHGVVENVPPVKTAAAKKTSTKKPARKRTKPPKKSTRKPAKKPTKKPTKKSIKKQRR